MGYHLAHPHTMEDFLQIGQTLQTAREARELTLQDATHQTRIPLSILTALENDDYSVFSSSTYARSYLSQYSEFLNVDASHWLDAFEPAEFIHDYHSLSIIDAGEVQQAVQRSRPSSNRKFIPAFLGLLLTATVLYGGYQILKAFEQREIVGEKLAATPIDNKKNADEKPPEVAMEPPIGATPHEPTESTIGNVAIPNITTTTPTQAAPTTPIIDSTPTAPPRAIIIDEDEE